MGFARLIALVSIASVATMVHGHGFVDKITVDGTVYSGFIISKDPWEKPPPQRIGWTTTVQNLGFIGPPGYQTKEMACHQGQKNAPIYAKVAGGGKVTVQWNGGDNSKLWPVGHKGPVLDYLARCDGDDCTTVDPGNLKFFKIAEAGLLDPNKAENGYWASDQLTESGSTWTVTIPADIAPGKYVYRHEIIALHSANGEGAQNYPQCINLEVTSGGSAQPAGVVASALYKADDPGIKIDIYWPKITSYKIPGPALYGGGGSTTNPGNGAPPVKSVNSETQGLPAGSTVTTTAAASVQSPTVPVAGKPVETTARPGNNPNENNYNNNYNNKANINPEGKITTTAAAAAAAAAAPTTTTTMATVTRTWTGGEYNAAAPTPPILPAQNAHVKVNPGDPIGTGGGPPKGTTLHQLLGWLATFFDKQTGEAYTGKSVVRRHVRSF